MGRQVENEGLARVEDWDLMVVARRADRQPGGDPRDIEVEMMFPPGAPGWALEALAQAMQMIGEDAGYTVVMGSGDVGRSLVQPMVNPFEAALRNGLQ